jgi:hypothetical protein
MLRFNVTSLYRRDSRDAFRGSTFFFRHSCNRHWSTTLVVAQLVFSRSLCCSYHCWCDLSCCRSISVDSSCCHSCCSLHGVASLLPVLLVAVSVTTLVVVSLVLLVDLCLVYFVVDYSVDQSFPSIGFTFGPVACGTNSTRRIFRKDNFSKLL